MKSFANDLLDNQQISRRRRSGSSGERPAGNRQGKKASRKSVSSRTARSAPVFRENSRFIDNIPQNPARNQFGNFLFGSGEGRASRTRSRNSFPRESFSPRELFRGLFEGPENPGREKPFREDSRRKRGGAVFFIPGVPFAALVLFALGVFFVIYNQAGALDWAGREVVSTEKDEGSRHNLALYAGVGSAEESPADDTGLEGAPIPLDLTETFAWQSYRVKRGDSVSKIAAAHSVSMDAIIASNGITNARALRVGEELRIPNMDGIPYTVKAGDSLLGISGAQGVPMEAILDANDLQSDTINAGMSLFIPGARMNGNDLKMALGELFVYPVNGARLSSPFGWRNDPISGVRRHHAAVDLSAPQGTPIKAAMDGKVSSMGYNGTYGNFIIISHGGGFQTMYAHLYTFSVKNGDQVRQGTRIGTVGSTGYSTGPHLHFAVFRNDRAVNPLDFLNPRS